MNASTVTMSFAINAMPIQDYMPYAAQVGIAPLESRSHAPWGNTTVKGKTDGLPVVLNHVFPKNSMTKGLR